MAQGKQGLSTQVNSIPLPNVLSYNIQCMSCLPHHDMFILGMCFIFVHDTIGRAKLDRFINKNKYFSKVPSRHMRFT